MPGRDRSLSISTSRASHGGWAAAFVQRLGELGWIDGKTVTVEHRWADGRPERYREIADEFVQLEVDVIATSGTPTTIASMRVTSKIPIVFMAAGDPVRTGLVASLARPGGNVTGTTLQQTDIAGKRLALLCKILPTLRRLAIIFNDDSRLNALELEELMAAASKLGLKVAKWQVRRAEEVIPAFDALKDSADALYICADPVINAHRVRLNQLALLARLPTICVFREDVEAGGLMTYGANIENLFRRAGDYVDKILRGTKPSDIPVEQPTKFDLIINLGTAKTLGLHVPPRLLAMADRLIN